MISINDIQEFNMKKLTGNERTIYMFVQNQRKILHIAKNNPTIFRSVELKTRYNMKELSKITGIHQRHVRQYCRNLESKNLVHTYINKGRLEVVL